MLAPMDPAARLADFLSVSFHERIPQRFADFRASLGKNEEAHVRALSFRAQRDYWCLRGDVAMAKGDDARAEYTKSVTLQRTMGMKDDDPHSVLHRLLHPKDHSRDRVELAEALTRKSGTLEWTLNCTIAHMDDREFVSSRLSRLEAAFRGSAQTEPRFWLARVYALLERTDDARSGLEAAFAYLKTKKSAREVASQKSLIALDPMLAPYLKKSRPAPTTPLDPFFTAIANELDSNPWTALQRLRALGSKFKDQAQRHDAMLLATQMLLLQMEDDGPAAVRREHGIKDSQVNEAWLRKQKASLKRSRPRSPRVTKFKAAMLTRFGTIFWK